jgi:hypothetical protein
MRSSVFIALSLLSAASIGATAVLLLETTPVRASSARVAPPEPPEFRWGEGTEASLAPVKAPAEQ